MARRITTIIAMVVAAKITIVRKKVIVLVIVEKCRISKDKSKMDGGTGGLWLNETTYYWQLVAGKKRSGPIPAV